MTDQSAQEPTMEEILASIRRIISEDDAPAETPPVAAAPEPAPAPEPEAPALSAPAPSPAFRDAAPVAYTPKHLAEKILTSKSAMEGERKGVTVMFADVSGFTAMSERLDPEDVHAIMDRAFEVILDNVHRYEGTINQFLGDGVMALFGAPIAHEDHPHRALSAALGIQEGLKPLQEDVRGAHGIEFRIRMGINTGLVVVGAIGKDLRMDYTAVGDTTNLAARLMSIAKPGQIVVSRRTQHLRDGFFVFEDLGEFQLKGKTEPVRAYTVISEIVGRTRLEVSKERGLTPLVGRERELQGLRQVYRRAVGGDGAIVLFAGDPGVGKSRLLYEFLQSLNGAGFLELETTCASYGRSMAYRPIVELLRRYLGLTDGVTGEEIRSHVAEQLQFLGLEGDEPAILLAHFLGVSAPPEFLNRLSGPQLKERTLGALRDVFLRASKSAPLILIVENMRRVAPLVPLTVGGNFDAATVDRYPALLAFLREQEFADRIFGPGGAQPNGLVHWPLGDLALPPEELEQLQPYDRALSRQLIRDATYLVTREHPLAQYDESVVCANTLFYLLCSAALHRFLLDDKNLHARNG